MEGDNAWILHLQMMAEKQCLFAPELLIKRLGLGVKQTNFVGRWLQ